MIDTRPTAGAGPLGRSSTVGKTEPAAPSTRDSGGADKSEVSLSPEARQLAALEQSARGAPDADSDRVAQLKAAVADGSYRVDARALAEKILLND